MLSQLKNLDASVEEAQAINFIIEKWGDSFEASLWENEVPKLSRISGRLYLAMGIHEFFVTMDGGIIHSILYDKYIEIITPKVIAEFMSKSTNEFFNQSHVLSLKTGTGLLWNATFPTNN